MISVNLGRGRKEKLPARLIRGANLVAWNRRDERKPTVPYNGSGPGGFSGRTTGRKRERENRCMTSGGQYFRAARMRPHSLLFTETDRRSNGAAAYFDEPQSRPTAYAAFLTAAFGSGASKNGYKAKSTITSLQNYLSILFHPKIHKLK